MFRFTIRDVLWLMVVVGLALGWWLWWRSIPIDCRVSGTITVSGQFLANGRVCFYSADGQISGAEVTSGQYRIHRILAGSYRVTIEGEGVPAKYAGKNSGLTADIRPVKNEFNFDLQ